MRKLVLILLVAPVALAGCMQSETGVEGRVLDRDTMKPVPGAEVKATSGTQEFRTTTDAEGRYAFHDLPPGSRKLRAEAEGYEESEYAEVTIEEGRMQTLDLFVVKEPADENE